MEGFSVKDKLNVFIMMDLLIMMLNYYFFFLYNINEVNLRSYTNLVIKIRRIWQLA